MSNVGNRMRNSIQASGALPVMLACSLLFGTAFAAPSITLSKKTGPPTSKILVSGSGFAPNIGVDIYFDTKYEALVVTNPQGKFRDTLIRAPREAHPGEHWVTALERNNDKGDQEPFVVNTNWSQFHFDADGTRWNPYENVLDPVNVGGISLAWSYTVGTMSSSPTVANGTVYIGSDEGSLYALDAATGVLRWSYATGSEVSSTPAVANGVVYFGSWDQNLYALDARTGIKLWSYATDGYVESSPAVADGAVYIGSDAGNVYALNAQTGAKLWSYTTGGAVSPSPAAANGLVYVESEDGHLYALNGSTGALLWNYGIGHCCLDGSGPAVANGIVYFGSEGRPSMYAVNATTGAAVWTVSIGAIFSLPAVADGIVYVGDNYDAYALDANTGAIVWGFHSGGSINSSAAVADGVAYFGSWDYNVYALDARTGTRLWNYTTGNILSASPTIANGTLYIGSRDGNLYAFHPTGEDLRTAHSAERPDLRTLDPDMTLKPSSSTVPPAN